jgi:hypothetical protein
MRQLPSRRRALLLAVLFAGLTGAAACRKSERQVLFDGKSLHGWSGNPTWTVKDGAIDFTGHAGRGTLLVSQGDYSNFRLLVRSRLVSEKNHLGVCFWGKRQPDHGYGECILVIPPSGGMWDYHPGKKGPPRTKLADPKFDPHVWHQTEVLAKRATGEVRMAVNGVELLRYKDEDPKRLLHGPIGLQAHSGESQVQYKDLEIEVDPKEPDRLVTVK